MSFTGYKTYAIAAASVAYGLIGMAMGWMDQSHAESLIQVGLVAAGLRAAK